MLSCENCRGEGRTLTVSGHPELCPRCGFHLDPEVAALNRRIEVTAKEILALKTLYDAEASPTNRAALLSATTSAGLKLDGLLQELAQHATE